MRANIERVWNEPFAFLPITLFMVMFMLLLLLLLLLGVDFVCNFFFFLFFFAFTEKAECICAGWWCCRVVNVSSIVPVMRWVKVHDDAERSERNRKKNEHIIVVYRNAYTVKCYRLSVCMLKNIFSCTQHILHMHIIEQHNMFMFMFMFGLHFYTKQAG